jgi:hypothetical protein
MIVDSSPLAAMSRSIPAWSTAIGFGCWKKGCGVWCGEERKTIRPRGGSETLDNCRSSRRRGGPDEEDGTDTAQSRVERFRHGEVAENDFDVPRQHRRRLGAMREGADRHARV